LCVQVEGLTDPLLRQDIVSRRLAFEADPDGFARTWRDQAQWWTDRIADGARNLPQVRLTDDALAEAVAICLDLGVDGHRGDLTVIKTAMTLAAFEGQHQTTIEHVHQAAELALPHRVRRRPFQEVQFNVLDRLAQSRPS
jgi:Mg-chelatase subunit ChlI